jgi:hypothetical protein
MQYKGTMTAEWFPGEFDVLLGWEGNKIVVYGIIDKYKVSV